MAIEVRRDEKAPIRTAATPSMRPIFFLSAAGSVLFAGFVFAYAAVGGPFVESLDKRLGEVLASEARAIRDAGDSEQAALLLRQALDAGFRDDRQAALAAQDYARLAIAASDFDLAIAALLPARDADPADGWNHALLTEAYRKAGRNDEALAAATAWRAMGESTGADGAVRWGAYNQGIIHRDAERFDAAYEAFRTSHDRVPNGDSAYQAAAAAHRLGRRDDARELAQWASENGEGQTGILAERLLEELAQP